MPKIIINTTIDISKPEWLRNQNPSMDLILASLEIEACGIEDGLPWLTLDENELPKLDGLNYTILPVPEDQKPA